MSIEKAIQENTEAVKALTVAISQMSVGASGAAVPGADVEKTTKKANAESTKKETAKEEKTVENEAPAKGDIPYDDVKAKTLDLVKAKGRDATVALVKEFGANYNSAKDLKTDQYAAYIARVDEILAEEDVA